jgi:hypothetical protein
MNEYFKMPRVSVFRFNDSKSEDRVQPLLVECTKKSKTCFERYIKVSGIGKYGFDDG